VEEKIGTGPDGWPCTSWGCGRGGWKEGVVPRACSRPWRVACLPLAGGFGVARVGTVGTVGTVSWGVWCRGSPGSAVGVQ
jgi:hypothetical protein